MIANPWVILAVALAWLTSVAGGYFYGGKHATNAIVAQEARDAARDEETRRVALQSAAEAIQKIEVRNVTIRQKAETITREVPIYSDCRHDPDGLRLINSALTGTDEPAPDGKLPAADPPRG